MAVLVAVNLLLAGGALVVRAQDDADPVSVGAALERYRAAEQVPGPASAPSATTAPVAGPAASEPEASPSGSPAPSTAPAAATSTPGVSTAGVGPWPATGVYVYDTTGFEETDALGGGRHDYPAQTTITVSPGGCGISLRWDIFEQRSDSTDLCAAPGGGSTIARIRARHEFFGQRDDTTATCGPGSYFLPAPNVAAGATWTFRCASESDEKTTTATFVGRETVQVDGTSIEVLHIRQQGTAGGSSAGTVDREMWITPDTGLVVRDRGHIQVSTRRGAIAASYSETYDIRLTSLRPQR